MTSAPEGYARTSIASTRVISRHHMALLRGALAVAGGLGVFTLALLGLNSVGRAIVGSDPEWINRDTTTRVVWLLGNVVCMVAGGYAAAWIAPRARVAHAVIVGTIQTGLTLAAFLTLRDNVTPTWLWVSGILLTVPAAWLGGRLRETHAGGSASEVSGLGGTRPT